MSGCGCGCQGSASATAVSAGLVRPRFFAGQLLTEDDLEALTGYVTAKNRLHNKYLFGAGVVCGLQVACSPCGGGTIRVQPGYALDCCGNDIVVDCPRELDVNRLIRDLRIDALGADCGDPCDPPGDRDDAERPPSTTRHYCLYVRFVEQPAEPVAPYATGEPCGNDACEPTRIREGHKFLLRCRQPETEIDDLLGRLLCCLPTQRERGTAELIDRLALYGPALTTAARTRDAPIAFAGGPDTARLVARLDALTGSLATLTAAGAEPAGDQARRMTDDVRALAATLVRFDMQDDATQAQLRTDHPDLGRIEQARTALTDATARLQVAVEATWTERLDREIATAALEQAARVGADATADLGRAEQLMFAQGLPWSSRSQAALADGAAALKEWLLDRLDAADWLTDCELRTIVAGIVVPAAAGAAPLQQATLGDAGAGAQQLTDALNRYLIDCLCSALNPPCRPCDDQDVLLACLEVRDCAVVRICNAARQHVISGTALRYWLPLQRLGQLIEALCCPPPASKPEKEKEPAEPAEPVQLAVALQVFGPASALPSQLLAPLASLGMRPLDFSGLADSGGAARDQLQVLDARIGGLAERLGLTRGQLSTARGLISKLTARVHALEAGGR